MSLNYSDRETLRPKLIPRCEAACLKFLLYTQGGGGSPSPTRVAWCTSNIPNVADLAQQLSHYLMSEPGFLGQGTDDAWIGGTDITDATIQSRIETVLQAFFMPT